ncbi:MAG: lysophospholipid acyltransferase family protein [Anaerolineales bacterium]|nr:lysophospholipid acyltransferase family protein [Anaerolineales bacterium]
MNKLLLAPLLVNKLQSFIGLCFLKLTGWEAVGNVPDTPKFVMLLAPHTSNWDLFYILVILYSFGIKFSWFGKKEIFRWPVGGFFKWLGGIPINRGLRKNIVQQTVEIIQAREQIIVGISPEGTRSNTKYWKTGFYYIANQAQVPIVFAFLDYGRKIGGLGPSLTPTGDFEEDMKTIRHFYSGITARHPQNFGNITIKPRLPSEELG